jgi:hypothetical protein
MADAQSGDALPGFWAALSIVRRLPGAKLFAEVVMMFIWLVPLGIALLLALYIFGRFRAG